MNNTYRKTVLASLAAVGLTLPIIASAAAPSQMGDDAIRVSFGDLDIHSKAGAKVLYTRLKRASEEACGIKPSVINGSLAETLRARTCYRETLEASVDEIGSTALKEIHAG
jgi:UrcA family protein